MKSDGEEKEISFADKKKRKSLLIISGLNILIHL